MKRAERGTTAMRRTRKLDMQSMSRRRSASRRDPSPRRPPVRTLLRSGAAGLFLCSAPAASWDADVLLGAGRVSRVRIPHISLASLGLAPATRRAAAAGTVVFEDCDEAILLGGYLAANGKALSWPASAADGHDVGPWL